MAEYTSEDVTLKRGDNVGGASITFTDVGTVTDFSGAERTLSVLTEHYLGSAEPVKTPSVYDFGEVTFNITFDPDSTQHAGLASDRDAKSNRDWTLNVSGATADVLAFSGYVTKVSPAVSAGEKLKSSVSIMMTSLTEWA